MSRTAAAELARLKVRFVAWSIRPVERGEGFTAQQKKGKRKSPKPPLRIHARTVSSLGAKLAEQEAGGTRGPQRTRAVVTTGTCHDQASPAGPG